MTADQSYPCKSRPSHPYTVPTALSAVSICLAGAKVSEVDRVQAINSKRALFPWTELPPYRLSWVSCAVFHGTGQHCHTMGRCWNENVNDCADFLGGNEAFGNCNPPYYANLNHHVHVFVSSLSTSMTYGHNVHITCTHHEESSGRSVSAPSQVRLLTPPPPSRTIKRVALALSVVISFHRKTRKHQCLAVHCQ